MEVLKRNPKRISKNNELAEGNDVENITNLMDFKSSLLRKTLCSLTMLMYLVGSFWLSRTRIQFLDELTSKITPNVFSTFVEETITYITTTYGRFEIAIVGTAIFHQVVYWVLSAPSFIYQFIPFMKKFKIQKRDVSMKMQLNCFKVVMLNQWLLEIPIMVGNYYFAEFMRYGWSYETFPTWYQLFASMVGCLAIEDTWHFFMHKRIHKGSLYQKVHKMHHEFVTPVGMQAEYAHPLEIFALSVGFLLGCCVYCNHFFSTWIWMIVRLTETIEVHGGYDCMLFLNICYLLPFYGGAKFHDFHHMNFIGNYASTFTCWDEVFDTILQYRFFLSKKKQ